MTPVHSGPSTCDSAHKFFMTTLQASALRWRYAEAPKHFFRPEETRREAYSSGYEHVQQRARRTHRHSLYIHPLQNVPCLLGNVICILYLGEINSNEDALTREPPERPVAGCGSAEQGTVHQSWAIIGGVRAYLHAIITDDELIHHDWHCTNMIVESLGTRTS